MKKAVLCGLLLLFFIYGALPVFCSDWDIDLLDTARDVQYLTDEEKNVILEMNKARNNPGVYARSYIEPRLAWFGGPFGNDHYLRPGDTIYIRQTGGRSAVVSAINALSRLPALQPLSPSRGMSLAARDHTLDTGPRGMVGHTGSDRSSLTQRLERYGRWNGRTGETISYGFNNAREIVIQLLISQGHRAIIMTGTHSHTGLSIGTHSQYNYMCTIKFADGYTDR
ncbi:MAG: CAP domain-containing protein [Treponema sp.]|nr:CAP domain-containing protein [Treponema sp.]